MFHASTEANGINNTIDLTTGALPVPANLMGMLPNNFASLMNNITGTTVERSSTSNKSLRKKKKRKLMKVCVDCTRSKLDQMYSKENKIQLTNHDSDSSTSTGYSNEDNSDFDGNSKMSASASKKGLLPTSRNKHTNALLVSPNPTEKVDISSESDASTNSDSLL